MDEMPAEKCGSLVAPDSPFQIFSSGAYLRTIFTHSSTRSE